MARSLLETRVKLRTFDHIFAFCRHLFWGMLSSLLDPQCAGKLLTIMSWGNPTEYYQTLYATLRGYIVRWRGTNRGMAKKSWSTGATKRRLRQLASYSKPHYLELISTY